MYNIAVIGDRDSVMGFGALGFDVYFAENRAQAKSALKKLASGSTAIIYITEKAASEIEDEIQKYDESPLPAIILIPGASGNTGAGINGVKKSVEQAVGSDIVFNN